MPSAVTLYLIRWHKEAVRKRYRDKSLSRTEIQGLRERIGMWGHKGKVVKDKPTGKEMKPSRLERNSHKD